MTAEVLVAFACDLYLEQSQGHHKPGTYALNLLRLQDFCERDGKLSVSALKPFHVTRWIESHEWSQSSISGAIAILEAAINHAVREGYHSENPLRSVKKPAIKRREAVLTAEQYNALLGATPDQQFRDFLVALHESGVRPGEVMGVTAMSTSRMASGRSSTRPRPRRGGGSSR